MNKLIRIVGLYAAAAIASGADCTEFRSNDPQYKPESKKNQQLKPGQSWGGKKKRKSKKGKR